MPRSLRSRLTVVIVAAAFLGLAVLTVGFNLQLRSNLDDDADRVLRSAAESGSETVEVRADGSFRFLERAGSEEGGAQVWVYQGAQALQRPREPAEVQSLADGLSGTDEKFAESVPLDTRLFSLAIDGEAGDQVGTVVSALNIEPYEKSASSALIASLIFASVVLIAMVAIGRMVLERALMPVSKMTREATEWSEHDLDHRFGVGEPHDELTELASAFDSMLDRLASSLRHEQRLSAEISHELRTPLASIAAETELALHNDASPEQRRQALVRIRERSLRLAGVLDSLMAAATADIDPDRVSSVVATVVEAAIADFSPLASSLGITVTAEIPGSLIVDVEADLLSRMIAPLLENACRYGRERVTISAGSSDGRAEIRVEDDGSGLEDVELASIFDPGVRGSAADGDPSIEGAGLGLTLVRRLAQAGGGDVRAENRPDEGAAFVIELPARRSARA